MGDDNPPTGGVRLPICTLYVRPICIRKSPYPTLISGFKPVTNPSSPSAHFTDTRTPGRG